MSTAFTVYVRPILEYNSVLWSPSLIRENVLRRFTKRLYVDSKTCHTYPDRLQRLSIPSRELRRLHLDLIFCYKIVFGLVGLLLILKTFYI